MADTPPVAIIMGSRSDWGVMKAAAAILDSLDVPYEAKVVSAHRTHGASAVGEYHARSVRSSGRRQGAIHRYGLRSVSVEHRRICR